MGKAPIGPSHLSKVLKVIKAEPKLSLSGVRSLKLSYAFRNDHFGARHFVKEELPRIKYANPNLQVEVDKVIKTREDNWGPEMELHYHNGTVKTIDMHDKWSTTILQELLETSGGEPWKRWKNNATRLGLPLFPGEEQAAMYTPPVRGAATFPNLKEWRALAPERELAKERLEKEKKTREEERAKEKAKLKSKGATEESATELPPEVLENLRTKTGAAAILP